MKKSSSKNSPAKGITNAANLEARFSAGRPVLDYFDPARAIVTHGGARTGAGRPTLGKARKLITLSPQAVRRVEAFARREKLPHFSAAIEALVLR